MQGWIEDFQASIIEKNSSGRPILPLLFFTV